ncbi:hypothetical protein AAG570_001664 [Ranatra chinensis]|uniref:Uncharacterized protein n=1 Tax=Ranatra chinensis TaxID=642074 RepID=A0ABD0YA09_9HEMI
MASKRRKMFYKNKKQETTEIGSVAVCRRFEADAQLHLQGITDQFGGVLPEGRLEEKVPAVAGSGSVDEMRPFVALAIILLLLDVHQGVDAARRSKKKRQEHGIYTQLQDLVGVRPIFPYSGITGRLYFEVPL